VTLAMQLLLDSIVTSLACADLPRRAAGREHSRFR
jgi:hypothetical protein